MGMFSFLNPVNWVKKAVASAVESAIDEYVTYRKGEEIVVSLSNKLVDMTKGKVSDERLRSISIGLRHMSEGCIVASEAVDPDGDEGRNITSEELRKIYDAIEGAFGELVTDEWMEQTRARLKALVREKIGV